jgi:hypothetical protein
MSRHSERSEESWSLGVATEILRCAQDDFMNNPVWQPVEKHEIGIWGAMPTQA